MAFGLNCDCFLVIVVYFALLISLPPPGSDLTWGRAYDLMDFRGKVFGDSGVISPDQIKQVGVGERDGVQGGGGG